jgi:hypothetical protein
MVGSGVGLYCAYVPFNCVIYDLMIASFKYAANSGFLIYISDFLGYLASIVVLFIKNFSSEGVTWDRAFMTLAFVVSVVGTVFMCLSLVYTVWKHRRWIPLDRYKKEESEEDGDQAVPT